MESPEAFAFTFAIPCISWNTKNIIPAGLPCHSWLFSFMKLNAYLSGGMEYAQNNGADWRVELESWLKRELRHGSFNPVKASERFLSSRYPGIDFRAAKSDDFNRHKEIAAEIVRLDSSEIILHSDYIICYYDESAQRGAGTKGELTVAALFGKPVYLIKGMPIADMPSWVIGCTTEMFDDFEELRKFLRDKFLH